MQCLQHGNCSNKTQNRKRLLNSNKPKRHIDRQEKLEIIKL